MDSVGKSTKIIEETKKGFLMPIYLAIFHSLLHEKWLVSRVLMWCCEKI